MKISAKGRQDLVAGVVIYAILLGLFLQTTGLPPDSALFPNITIVLLALLNTAMVVSAFKKSGDGSVTLRTVKMPLLYFAGIVAYVILFRYLGYFPSTAAMLIGIMAASRVKPWWKNILIVVVYLAFIYVLFVVWLKVSLI